MKTWENLASHESLTGTVFLKERQRQPKAGPFPSVRGMQPSGEINWWRLNSWIGVWGREQLVYRTCKGMRLLGRQMTKEALLGRVSNKAGSQPLSSPVFPQCLLCALSWTLCGTPISLLQLHSWRKLRRRGWGCYWQGQSRWSAWMEASWRREEWTLKPAARHLPSDSTGSMLGNTLSIPRVWCALRAKLLPRTRVQFSLGNISRH